MADANENKTASNDFADDLDAMLNDADSSSNNESDEFIDDEDAIDRLLMNDTSEVEEDEFAEIDEFSEDPEPLAEQPASEVTNEEEDDDDDDFDVDELISPSSNEFSNNEDTADETDEFSASSEKDSDDDFLMADFDISSDDDDEFADSEIDEFSEETTTTTDNQENSIEKLAESPPTSSTSVEAVSEPASTINTEEIAQANIAIDGINAQISQLWADNEDLKNQITELVDSTSQNKANATEIETLRTEQQKLKKSLRENANNISTITFIALGIAIVALLVGGGLGFIGFNAHSEVTELAELVTMLEEEIEIVAANDSSKDVKKINEKIASLSKSNSTVEDQINKINKALQDTQLKPVVDDLVVQNDHAQQAIETLLAKVETLENRKKIAAKASRAKKIVPKVTWVVNLVSFKQEWYAKRKASEFDKKGIPAEVQKVKVKGQTWFRLTVKGFKSKYAAAAYAVKVKKTLNLSSAWVTKN